MSNHSIASLKSSEPVLRSRLMNFCTISEYSVATTPPVVAIAAGDKVSNIVVGTGVIIAPYLALTARHNMDKGILKHFYADRLLRRDGSIRIPTEVDLNIQVAHGHGSNASAFCFKVEAFSLSEVSDLALLRIRPLFSEEGYKWPCVNISIFPPAVGVLTTAYGYVYGDGEVELGFERAPPFMYRSQGMVRRVHFEQRGSGMLEFPFEQRGPGMLDFPCFQTNARYDHAMSGGPVFLPDGRVVGLIASELPPEEDGERFSFATSLSPLLGSRIEAWLPGNFQPKERSVKELVDIGLVRIDHVNSFQYEYDVNGRVERMFYSKSLDTEARRDGGMTFCVE